MKRKRINTARERNKKRAASTSRDGGIRIEETATGIKFDINDSSGNGIVVELDVARTIRVAAAMMIAIRPAAERAGRSWNSIGDEFFDALQAAQGQAVVLHPIDEIPS